MGNESNNGVEISVVEMSKEACDDYNGFRAGCKYKGMCSGGCYLNWSLESSGRSDTQEITDFPCIASTCLFVDHARELLGRNYGEADGIEKNIRMHYETAEARATIENEENKIEYLPSGKIDDVPEMSAEDVATVEKRLRLVHGDDIVLGNDDYAEKD